MHGSKIAFLTDKATAPEYENLDSEHGKIMAYLKEKGFQPSCQIWDDEKIDWLGFDVLIMKTTWDYHHRLVEFNAWLNKLEKIGAYVLNPIDVLRWNSDKIYLKELEENGARIANTIWLGQGENFDVNRLFAELNTEKIIIKPRVSASANHTYALTQEEAHQKKEEIEGLLRTENLMAQSFLKEIQTEGEWSLLFFDGKFSHSLMKVPKADDFRVQSHHGGSVKAVEVPSHLVKTAQSIVDNHTKGCLYARVDGVEVDGQFVLMELELIEPYFFINQSNFSNISIPKSKSPS
ncbi:MAG: hypothetical protein EOO46_24410 [Flavobacterium sp.]|nr:MAG: hypothetical protein EOO46_24410 [Flavobacterium sp.]